MIKRPYVLKGANKVELWSELTILMLTYHIMAFGGFVEHAWLNFYVIGWSYIFTIFFTIIL